MSDQENKLAPEDIKLQIERRVGIPPEELSAANLEEAGCLRVVCVLPKQLNERASYLADSLVQMICRYPKDDQLRATVGQLCQALSYMMNSTSWREGKLHDFDQQELKRKLSRFA